MAASPGLQFENQVRGALKRIGLKDVDGGATFKIGGHQVDACGGWDDVLLIIECVQTERGDASIRDEITAWRGKIGDIRRGFRQLDSYKSYTRFEFAIASRNFRHTDADKALAVGTPKIHLIDWQLIDYYKELSSIIGQESAVFNLLGELNVEPRDIQVPRVPAMKVELTKGVRGGNYIANYPLTSERPSPDHGDREPSITR